VEHAGRTLTFDAWYGESVAESAIESMRIRKVGRINVQQQFVLLHAVARRVVCMAAGRGATYVYGRTGCECAEAGFEPR
jgi:hypothetical protein